MSGCPFKIGQVVYYRPSMRGHGWSMDNLVIGDAYEVSRILYDGGAEYVELKDRPLPSGGIHWTEFSAT